MLRVGSSFLFLLFLNMTQSQVANRAITDENTLRRRLASIIKQEYIIQRHTDLSPGYHYIVDI